MHLFCKFEIISKEKFIYLKRNRHFKVYQEPQLPTGGEVNIFLKAE